MKIQLLCLFSFVSLQASSSEMIELTSVRTPCNEKLFHHDGNFMIQREGKSQVIPSYAVNRDIRSHDIAALLSLQQHGYFDLQRSVEGNEYRIEFQPRLNGGGRLAGFAAYYLTKAIIYGCTLGLASVFFKKKNSPVHNIVVDSAIIKVGEQLTSGVGYVGAVVANHDGVRQAVQDAVPIVIMTMGSAPTVTTPIWIESAALGAQAIFDRILFLP